MCGVFGIHNHPEAGNIAYLGLHALQHRGQESAGVVTSDGTTLHAVRKMGLVGDIFTERKLALLPGRCAVGHVRYTTAGGSLPKNIQPLTAASQHGAIAIAHNGNLVNAGELRDRIEIEGGIFHSDADTEVIMQLMARSRASSTVDRLKDALAIVRGAYSLVVLRGEQLIAVRDPNGFRPLILGRLKGYENCHVVASETSSFDLIGAEKIRDVAPGEILIIDENGLTSSQLPEAPKRFCVFEHVYFARPDSVLDGVSVYDVRIRMGERLAAEAPADADVVIPVPDSGVVASMGYARASGLPFEMGLIRNHYVGRTFIEPKDSIRHFGVKLKLNPVPQLLRGKRVVVVDDSIVRGTTSRKIVKMIRDAGAREVHVRISSPPVGWSCFYGIDTPTREELIASRETPDGIARFITADSLAYLSPEGLLEAVGGDKDPNKARYCTACFTGLYPVQQPAPRSRRHPQLVEV